MALSAEPPLAEVATIRSDPNRHFYGNRIVPEDRLLATRGATRGLGLYDELEGDPQVAATLSARRLAVVGREWSVEPGDSSASAEDAAQLVRLALKGLSFNRAVEALLGALLIGIAVSEVMWAVRAGLVLPAALRSRDPRRFTFHAGEAGPELRLLTREAPIDGIALPPRKFAVHRHGGLREDPWGLGLGSRLYWPVYFKRQGIGFWLSALEKFGQPTAIGRYPTGVTEEQQKTLLGALQAIASEAGVIVPEGMEVQLLEARRQGTFDTYERLARYMDDDIAKVVLGQTLTTAPGASGSRALGEVHNQVRLEIAKADADRLSDTLNATLIPWIVDLNRPGYAAEGRPYPAIWWEVSRPRDQLAIADRDLGIRALGYRPTEDHIRQTYGPGWEPDGREAP